MALMRPRVHYAVACLVFPTFDLLRQVHSCPEQLAHHGLCVPPMLPQPVQVDGQ
jgi:hypothetical protein